MSTGKFKTVSYESNQGRHYRCVIQPESEEAVLDGTENLGSATAYDKTLPSVLRSKSKRQHGIRPRTVTLELTESGSGALSDYKIGSRYTIPVFRKSVWDGTSEGDEALYMGLSAVIRSMADEDID
jgi:hypothetical protein